MWGHVRVKKIEWVVKTGQIRNRSFLYNRAWLWFRRGHLKWISSWWLLIKKKRDPKIDWKGGCEIDYLTTLIRDKQQIELVPSMSFYFITAVTPPESGNAYDLFIIKPNPFARNIQTALNSSDVNALWVTSAQSTFAATLIYRNYSSFFRSTHFEPVFFDLRSCLEDYLTNWIGVPFSRNTFSTLLTGMLEIY